MLLDDITARIEVMAKLHKSLALGAQRSPRRVKPVFGMSEEIPSST